MNKISTFILAYTRRLYIRLFKLSNQKPYLRFNYRGQAASDFIKRTLAGDEPCMISRFGSYELDATLNYIDVIAKGSLSSKAVKYIRGEIGPFWWGDKIAFLMLNNAGFFPANNECLQEFAKIMLNEIRNIDILGTKLILKFLFHPLKGL